MVALVSVEPRPARRWVQGWVDETNAAALEILVGIVPKQQRPAYHAALQLSGTASRDLSW
jgi:hypothetical protein